ncbi:MAG: C39 family peptidase [Sporolactobacillus sp.]
MAEKKILLDVPLAAQMPELARGCEVTSLAMLLNFAGLSVDKMMLADQIKKSPVRYQKKKGDTFFGDPNAGFIGSMTEFKTPGLGVYHSPIAELAEMYLGSRVLDLTPADFSQVEESLKNGRPVWVITNEWFKALPKRYFHTWYTENGPKQITYKEHSVVVTGFEAEFVYFNDPLRPQKNRRAFKRKFIEGWEQMGAQAVTYI